MYYMLYTGNEDETRPNLFALDKPRRLIGIVTREDPGDPPPKVLFGDIPNAPVFSRTITEPVGEDRDERHFRISWFALPPEFLELSLQTRSGRSPFLWRKESFESLDKTRLFADDTAPQRSLFSRVRGFLANLPPLRSRYQNSWLLVDRDFKADDNAEHLYRWTMRHHPEQKIFFALSKKSPDWARLKRDGFRLVPLGSLRYFFAWLHCDWLVSSNVTSYIRRPRWRKIYADIVRHRFCFLQHGITKDYQPAFNTHLHDMIATGAEKERDAFTSDPRFPYVYSEREIQLTGFPRHDELLRKAAAAKRPDIILIVPTWRRNLFAELLPGTGQYPYSETFRKSLFFQNWQNVLQCKTLHGSAKKFGYELHFFPHAYIRQQLRDFDFSGVTVQRDAGGSIQDLLARTALLITDYSSMAMEAAMIRRPVLYFQFDRDSFIREHMYTQGYFDYGLDGFGEIAATVDALSSKALSCMENACVMPPLYKNRADAFFAFNDQNNCQRVHETLLRLSRPISIVRRE